MYVGYYIRQSNHFSIHGNMLKSYENFYFSKKIPVNSSFQTESLNAVTKVLN